MVNVQLVLLRRVPCSKRLRLLTPNPCFRKLSRSTFRLAVPIDAIDAACLFSLTVAQRADPSGSHCFLRTIERCCKMHVVCLVSNS